MSRKDNNFESDESSSGSSNSDDSVPVLKKTRVRKAIARKAALQRNQIVMKALKVLKAPLKKRKKRHTKGRLKKKRSWMKKKAGIKVVQVSTFLILSCLLEFSW